VTPPRSATLLFAPLLLVACGGSTTDPAPSAPPPTASAAGLLAAAPDAPPRPHRAPASRSGSALARTPAGDALLLADEDHQVLRRIPLPLDVNTPPLVIPVPGGPAQVIALDDSVLVTVRDPGLLIVYRPAGEGLVETGRVDLPADAWGLAVTADEKTALISSGWTHQISAVDLSTMRKRWSVPVAREPRGLAVTARGTAYISHLVGPGLTRIDALASDRPEVSAVTLAAAPLRAPRGLTLDASLGYAPVLSPDDSRLFVPRHALGAQGRFWWFGQPTVDVLLTADDSPLAPKRARNTMTYIQPDSFSSGDTALMELDGPVPLSETESFVQPRAAVYRASTDTLVIASEGLDTLTEVDARSLDPSLHPLRTYSLGTYDREAIYPEPSVVVSGGAPSAVALSVDESTAYVFCRSTDDISSVLLDSHDPEKPYVSGPIPFVHLADDTLPELASKGRRLYYTATDSTISGGMGCAGCHPDGRDDGHVWHENDSDGGESLGYRSGVVTFPDRRVASGVPRQTPMLAGRVASHGPYGWNGKSPDLEDRLRVGFALHRWGGSPDTRWLVTMDRPKAIAAFLRQGLVAPPREALPLTAEEERGKEVFLDGKVGCAACHVPTTEFTDRSIVALPRPQRSGFDAEKNVPFKTPSLLFVGGTAPYFHDGSAATLEDVILSNNDAMGHTSHLSTADRSALIAYLKTL
jgi:DNA-binding beta-propeller fold protein YncE/mono/diheme cytochrome c family protein